VPDGEDRNDYQHKKFKPFDYKDHGANWTDWEMATKGKE
jgi:carbonic anhydrase